MGLGRVSSPSAQNPLSQDTSCALAVGAAYKGGRVILLVAGREVRILSLDGSPLRRLMLDPTKDYQPMV